MSFCRGAHRAKTCFGSAVAWRDAAYLQGMIQICAGQKNVPVGFVQAHLKGGESECQEECRVGARHFELEGRMA